jgi:hypothetical protein
MKNTTATSPANFDALSINIQMRKKAGKSINVFQGVSQETKNRVAVDLTLLDAIEQGMNTTGELCSFMMTPTFDASVSNYLQLIG